MTAVRVPFVLGALVGLVASWCLAGGCGGKTWVDGGASGSGASASEGADGAGGDGVCAELAAEYLTSLVEAKRCEICEMGIEECAYNAHAEGMTDLCGCPVAVSMSDSDRLAHAIRDWRRWIDAGCGPRSCETPCPPESEPRCVKTGPACAGLCCRGHCVP